MTQEKTEKEWLSPEELAAWLGLGRTRVYEMLGSGGPDALPSYKIGRLRRIRRSDVETWLVRHKAGTWQ